MNKNQQHRTDDHQRSSLAYPIIHITEKRSKEQSSQW